MTFKICASGGAALLLLGCVEVQSTPIAPPSDFITDLPEQIVTAVSPSQDLSAVKIDPIDGCYVYQYRGPVETTFLPLMTRDGRMICLPKEAPVTEDAAS